MFEPKQTNTNIFSSKICKEANEKNPCNIIINFDGNKVHNYYKPSENKISISIHKSAVDWVLYDFNGDLRKAASNDKNGALMQEFSEIKIKSTISHELTHWLDETCNNNSITKELNKIKTKYAKDPKYFVGKNNVNSKYFEINAQINAIAQAKKQINDEEWNSMTFDQLINLIISLKTINKTLSQSDKIKWLRNLKTRMYRENLLGKNMYNK